MRVNLPSNHVVRKEKSERLVENIEQSVLKKQAENHSQA